jgi:hypothetical protein
MTGVAYIQIWMRNDERCWKSRYFTVRAEIQSDAETEQSDLQDDQRQGDDFPSHAELLAALREVFVERVNREESRQLNAKGEQVRNDGGERRDQPGEIDFPE